MSLEDCWIDVSSFRQTLLEYRAKLYDLHSACNTKGSSQQVREILPLLRRLHKSLNETQAAVEELKTKLSYLKDVDDCFPWSNT